MRLAINIFSKMSLGNTFILNLKKINPAVIHTDRQTDRKVYKMCNSWRSLETPTSNILIWSLYRNFQGYIFTTDVTGTWRWLQMSDMYLFIVLKGSLYLTVFSTARFITSNLAIPWNLEIHLNKESRTIRRSLKLPSI